MHEFLLECFRYSTEKQREQKQTNHYENLQFTVIITPGNSYTSNRSLFSVRYMFSNMLHQSYVKYQPTWYLIKKGQIYTAQQKEHVN